MRSRETILAVSNVGGYSYDVGAQHDSQLILEVLLDIRELLQKQEERAVDKEKRANDYNNGFGNN